METTKKPICKLVGQDGNIFNLLGIANKTLRKAGLIDEISEMMTKVSKCSSYSEALDLVGQYVTIK